MFYFIMDRTATPEGRLFLAVFPDAPKAARIFRLAGGLKYAHRFSGRLIAADRLHASLFFLGGLPERMILAACETLSEVCLPPFEVSFDRTASFRGRPGSRPFVLMGGEGVRPLKALREVIGNKLAQQGFRRRANTNLNLMSRYCTTIAVWRSIHLPNRLPGRSANLC